MEDLAPFLNKKYKLAASENFDDLLKAYGVGWVIRKMVNSATSTVELSEKDDMYCITSSSTFKNSEIKFKLGEEFDEALPDGQKVKSIITQEGNRLVHFQRGKKECKVIREFSPDELKIVITLDDVICTRIYKVL